MTETTPDMTGTLQAKAKLYAAVARLQSELPSISKGKTADTGTYKYKYADLPAVSEAILPKLGKLGLAFVAFPTLNADGKFVLAYSLVHEAGAEMGGEYRLPDNGSPQQIGSAITYARRYALCAVTGIAADEDDDGAAAQQGWQHSANRGQQRGRQDNAPRPQPQRQMPRPDRDARPLSPEDPWAAKVEGVATVEDADAVNAELKQLFEESGISAGHAAQVKAALDARVAEIRIPPNQRARSSQPQENGDGSDEAAFTRDFMSRLARADADRDFVGMRTELARAVSSRKIAPETANELIEKLNERKAKAAV